MILLNNREFKEFEIVYQSLKGYPDWRMENIFHSKSREYDEFKTCGRLFYVRIKQNRLMLASHESAHAVVFSATYRYVDSVNIDLKGHPEGLLGMVTPACERKDESCQLIQHESEIPCKPLVIMNLLVKAAGFIGESLVGRKTGSYHEKFHVYCQTRFLDDKDQVAPLTNWEFYVCWCKKIILNNENLFWRVVDDLLKNSQLTNEIKDLLHSKIKKESATKFFY